MEVNANREGSLEPENDFSCACGVYTEHSDFSVGVQMYNTLLMMFFIYKALHLVVKILPSFSYEIKICITVCFDPPLEEKVLLWIC